MIFFSWIGKNIITSGCAAFPIEQTCFKTLQWFDKSETRRSNAKSGRIENEAWTKGAPNQNEKVLKNLFKLLNGSILGKNIMEKNNKKNNSFLNFCFNFYTIYCNDWKK